MFNPNPEGWQLNIQSRLRELLTTEEFNAAQASILNAHYTSEEVIQAMWDVMQHLGFTGGSVLEPSCGSDKFITHAPDLDLKWTAVELDPISAAICQQLPPSQAP